MKLKFNGRSKGYLFIIINKLSWDVMLQMYNAKHLTLSTIEWLNNCILKSNSHNLIFLLLFFPVLLFILLYNQQHRLRLNGQDAGNISNAMVHLWIAQVNPPSKRKNQSDSVKESGLKWKKFVHLIKKIKKNDEEKEKEKEEEEEEEEASNIKLLFPLDIVTIKVKCISCFIL